MGDAWDELRARLGGLVQTEAKSPLWTVVPPARSDVPLDPAPLRPGLDYVQVRVQRVHLAPGGSAFAFLTWRTYTGWADAETPQTVTVALDPASPAQEAAVNADHGPAPFDIADGGTWGIAPWASPPWED